jgi:RNA polymerase sigma-70 factor (ECF subfamily)
MKGPFRQVEGGEMRVTDNELEYYIRHFRKNVYNAVLCYVRNPSDAEDITQNTFFKLYTYTKSFNDDEHVKAWLLRCAINECKNHLRSHWYRFSAPLESAKDMTCSDNTDHDDEMLGIMKKLSKNNRIALYMYYYEGYTIEEIGHILDVSSDTVSSRLHRGRQQLKKLLSEERNGLFNEL